MMFCTTVPVHCGVVRDFLIRAVSISVELKLKILEDEKKNYLTASPNDPAQRVEMQILAVYGWGVDSLGQRNLNLDGRIFGLCNL